MKENILPPTIEDLCKRTDKSPAEVHDFLDLLKRSMQPYAQDINVIENSTERLYRVERQGLGILNTEYGKFWQYNFYIDDPWEKYSAIVKGELDHELLIPLFSNKEQLMIRTDSGCETGQLFGDMTCECRGQLHYALEVISKAGEGMVISIPKQDGRGLGINFKLGTLWLQEVLGVDTVEAAVLLAGENPIDVRTYSGVVGILKFFNIQAGCKINLATNNPKKAEIFIENGYTVADYTPIVIEATTHTKRHLIAKGKHLGHKNLLTEGGVDENE